MTKPAEPNVEGDVEDQNESAKLNENTGADVSIDVDPADDSKAHLISANGGAGGGDPLDVKIVDGTATSSEAEVSFNGLGKDEVMKYADEPFWKKLRLILFILFWVGWFAMLVTAIVIIVLAPRCPPRPDLKWYQTDTVYQVLPESFKDSDDNGKGDFEGLKDKADYVFDDLGAKAIWLSSMYKTDGDDSGLGIQDHMAVADWFGATKSDIKSWMKSLMKKGQRVILDLIPNQTSKKHMWFEKSQKSEGKFENYYVWRDNKDGSPPNDWVTEKGESMWTLDTTRNAWYLHQISSDLPDLDLTNPDVVDSIKEIMRFWLDAGAGGFNVRDIEYLVEDDFSKPQDANRSQTFNNNGTLAVLEQLREVIDDYSDKPGKERVLFATMRTATPEQALAYWGPKSSKRLHIVAPILSGLTETTTADEVKTMVEAWLTDDRYQWLGYVLGSPDVSRPASRLQTKEKLTIAHAIQLLMPGTPFNYYGDEFGQKDVMVPAVDQIYKNGKDGFRTPMQWDSSKNAGFTKADKPYLPVGDDYKTNHAAAGSALFSEETPLKAFKDLVKLREEKESLQFGKTKVCAPESDLLMFTRKAERFPYLLTLINMGDSQKTFYLESYDCVTSRPKGTVRFHSRDDSIDEDFDFHENAITLERGDVVVVEFAAED